MRRSLVVLFISLVLTSVYSATEPETSSTKTRTVAGRPQVFILQDGKEIRLTQFSSIREILYSEVSPNGRFCLVWSKRPAIPRELEIYDLPAGKLRKSFRPGFGGGLGWTSRNQIFHGWGCGTFCWMTQLYNTDGHTLYTFNSGYSIVSSSGDYIFLSKVPYAPDEIVDLRNGRMQELNGSFVRNFEVTLETTWLEIHDVLVTRCDQQGWLTFYSPQRSKSIKIDFDRKFSGMKLVGDTLFIQEENSNEWQPSLRLDAFPQLRQFFSQIHK